MTMMSQASYEEIVFRAGMEVRGGNLSLLPRVDPAHGEADGTAAWAGRGMGLFIVNARGPQTIDLEAIALRDVIACTVVLGNSGAATDFAIGRRRFEAEGSDMTMVFVPRGERFRFATQTRQGLKAVTIMVDPVSILKTYDFDTSALPASLLKTIDARETMMDKLIPGHFGLVAIDILARRCLSVRCSALLRGQDARIDLDVAEPALAARRDARVVNGRDYAVQTRWLPALTPNAISAIVEAGSNLTSPLSTVILQHFRGAATQVPLEATAFGLRREHVLVEMISSWEGEDGANHRSWAHNLSEALAPDALPGGYPSLLAPDDHDRIAEAYGSNLKRLKSVKQRFDPDGLFSAMPLPV